MRVSRVFVKLGGSFITDKSVAGSLRPGRVRTAARMIRLAVERVRREGGRLDVVLGHGAGSYGHVPAVRFKAVEGVHPRHGWRGFHAIRRSMAEMNLRFVRLCGEAGLFPVAVQPSAVVLARDGKVARFDAANILALLEAGQAPLIHGDIVPDSVRGFTIASTEALLAALSAGVRFDRAVMVSDTDGVLDKDGRTIARIETRGLAGLAGALKGSAAPDVTGGMRRKVQVLLSLVAKGRVGEARIISAARRPENLLAAVLGRGGGGTLLCR